MPARPSIFISHSSQDLQFARLLQRRLQGQGVDAWLDDLQLHVGDALTDTIARALKQHDYLIVVLSRASVASKWVNKEITLARNGKGRRRKATIVPVLLDRQALKKLPQALRDLKYVDFSTRQFFEVALAQVMELIGHGLSRLPKKRGIEKIEFVRGDAISAALRANITRLLADYQAYIRRLGFRSRDGALDMAFERDASFISSYDPTYDRIVTHEAYAGEEDYLRRDYTHHALVTTRPEQWRRSGRDWSLAALESGLAAYFPCSFRDHHLFGDGAARILGQEVPLFDLTNMRRFGEIEDNAESVATAGLEVWGGAFWQVRAALGARRADTLLWRVWCEFKAAPRRNDLAFARLLVKLAGTQHERIARIFVERGLALSRRR